MASFLNDLFLGEKLSKKELMIKRSLSDKAIKKISKIDTIKICLYKDGNEIKAFGFLMLENRLNVAFSRAIRLLITVGDGSMFADDFAQRHVKGLYELYTHQTQLQYGILIK